MRYFPRALNVYAYSVDDAVGNIQAEGTGFIIDVGDTKHLENHEGDLIAKLLTLRDPRKRAESPVRRRLSRAGPADPLR
jgi:hypothetical protein